jgi:hypothetical protein
MLDRFCSQILPEIHYKINSLHLEALSMERILLAPDYPNIRHLGLYNVDEKTTQRVFTGKIIDFDCFQPYQNITNKSIELF